MALVVPFNMLPQGCNRKCPESWRNIAFTRIDPAKRVLSEIVLTEVTTSLPIADWLFSGYCSFAYSALLSFMMGMSLSASFQSVRKFL